MWIVIAIVAVLIVSGILVAWMAWKRKKEGKQEEPNYRVFFIVGMFMTPIGIIGMTTSFFTDISFFTAFPFFSIGVVYIAIGLGNRNKWKKHI